MAMTISHDIEVTELAAAAAAIGPFGGPHHWTGADAASRWPATAAALGPELAAHADEHDRRGDFVDDGFDLVRDHGLLALLVPTEAGGGGATFAEACATLAELARACPSTALALSMHTHLVAAQVWRHHRGLPAPVLAKVVQNEVVLVSTGASDWFESGGTTRRVDGGYIVSGRKMPASGAPAGDVLVTSMRWEDAPEGPQVIHAAVPFSAQGMSIEETWDTLGMRATGSHTVVLDEVFVPDGAVALIRPAGQWHPVWSIVLGAALPLIMSCYVGVAEAIAERAVALAAPRRERPEVAGAVGRMLNRLTVARDTVRAMIDAADDLRFDNTLDHAATSLARKTISAEAVTDVAAQAMELGGGAAFLRSAGVERLFRDVQGARYHPLPAARQERFTGRFALGLDPLS